MTTKRKGKTGIRELDDPEDRYYGRDFPREEGARIDLRAADRLFQRDPDMANRYEYDPVAGKLRPRKKKHRRSDTLLRGED